MTSLAWAATYAAHTDPSVSDFASLTLSVGIGSAVAIPIGHELMHRRSQFDVLLARLMAALCLYGHMLIEYLHITRRWV